CGGTMSGWIPARGRDDIVAGNSDLAPDLAPVYPFFMVMPLAALPPVATPLFDAWRAGLAPDETDAIAAVEPTLGPLLEAAPYLLALAQANAAWLAAALRADADGALAAVLAGVEQAGR